MSKERVVGILDPPTGQYLRDVAIGVCGYASTHGHWVLQPTSQRGARPGRIRLDGMVAAMHTPETERALGCFDCPIVNVSGAPRQMGWPSVIADSEEIGRLAAAYLLEHGFRDFSFIGHNAAFSDERERGFRRCVEASGFRCRLWHGDRLYPPQPPAISGSRGNRIENVRRWLSECVYPTAVFAATDHQAVVFMQALRELHVRVPDDVSVIGVDNDTVLTSVTYPPLSSIDPNGVSIGFQAAALLEQLMDGERSGSPTVLRVLPKSVCARASTDAFAVSDARVRRALSYIRDHLDTTLDVPRVARFAGASRRALEVAFRIALDRSILQEIRRQKLNAAARLLVDTDLPMPDIAERAGFGTPEYLATAFRRAKGLSPSAWRRSRRPVVRLLQ